MHVNERRLLRAVAARDPRTSCREIAQRVGDYKQNCYYFDKWASRNWYDWGVNLDLGWLTDKGKEVAAGLSDT